MTDQPVALDADDAESFAFHGDFAVAGLSMQRERAFSDLELDDNLKDKDAEPRCGLMVIDLRSGDRVHYMRIEGAITELCDVVILPGVRRPTAVGFGTDEIRRVITMGRLNGAPEDAQANPLFVRDPKTPLGADVVDKLPHNFLHLGLIAAMFPNAKIVVMRRATQDIAISNYFSNFKAEPLPGDNLLALFDRDAAAAQVTVVGEPSTAMVDQQPDRQGARHRRFGRLAATDQ